MQSHVENNPSIGIVGHHKETAHGYLLAVYFRDRRQYDRLRLEEDGLGVYVQATKDGSFSTPTMHSIYNPDPIFYDFSISDIGVIGEYILGYIMERGVTKRDGDWNIPVRNH